MNFELTESQKLLRKTARDVLETECPKKLVKEMELDQKGYSPKLQRKMADLGWLGLIFPEKYGGMGGDFVDLMVLLEEMGRALLPGPFFSTVILGSLPILEIGSEEQKQRFLPKIAESEINLTMALAEPNSRYGIDSIEVKAIRDENEYIVNGIKLFASYAHVADYLICVAKTKEESAESQGTTLFLIDSKSPGITCHVLETIGMDKQCEVIFENTRVPEGNILGKLDYGWPPLENLLQKVAIAKCAEMVGGMQQVLEMTVDYAKQRVLFGRPIGGFQVIQSRCVEMLGLLEDSRLLTYEAGWKLEQGLSCANEVSMAKAQASEAYRVVTTLAHGICGGTAYCVDHDLNLYYRRAKSADVSFGDADSHRERIAVELGL